MIVGVDFDNTIVCYDKLFYKVALKKRLIPKNLPAIKDEIRNYLREQKKENAWTELQGLIYGPRIFYAEPFSGVLDFFAYCKKHKISVYIISHKTRHPFLGSKHDLHMFAYKWLEEHGFYDLRKTGLSKNDVFFELTKEKKLMRIFKQKCTHYIDDLPEFLSEQKFPPGVKRVLFDPNGKYKNKYGFGYVTSWAEMIKKIK